MDNNSCEYAANVIGYMIDYNDPFCKYDQRVAVFITWKCLSLENARNNTCMNQQLEGFYYRGSAVQPGAGALPELIETSKRETGGKSYCMRMLKEVSSLV